MLTLRMAAGMLLLAMLGAAPVQAARTGLDLRRWPGEIDVMTQNQYMGADLTPLRTASSAKSLNEAVLKILRQVAANYFPRRAERQAATIVRHRPDLVALQEVFHFGCKELPPFSGACSEPSIARAFGDQLTATLAALRARGADYRVAASVVNFDLRELEIRLPGLGKLRGIPFVIDGKLALLTLYDRDVILQRPGVETQPVRFAGCRRSAQGCNYQAAAELPLPMLGELAGVRIKRGYVAVDATVRGRKFRFVNTHLEIPDVQPGDPRSPSVQNAQATELLAALNQPEAGEPQPPLIVAGDFNAAPLDRPSGAIGSPYAQFVAGGFSDVWRARAGRAPGFTCCQAADLRNKASQLFERIDLIFTQPPITARQVRLLGERPEDKTWPLDGTRLWPSDHAGLSARLRLMPPPATGASLP